MSLSVWQRNIVTEAGDVIPDAEIEVFDAGSSSKPDLFSDPDGNSSITNPFNADSNGFARFYVSGGRYDIAVNGAVLWEDVALGTTQGRDTGSAPSEVPTNNDANARGFAQTVDSVSDLRAATFPASLQRLWLSGYNGVGTAGGGPLYRDGESTEDDNGGTVFVDADGVRWKRAATGVATPEEWGAVGDGVTDDTESLRGAIGSSALVVDGGNGTYAVSDYLPIPSNQTIQNIKVIALSSFEGSSLFYMSQSEDVVFKGLQVDGDAVEDVLVFDATDSNRISITDFQFQSLYAFEGSNSIISSFSECSDVRVSGGTIIETDSRSGFRFIDCTRCVFDSITADNIRGRIVSALGSSILRYSNVDIGTAFGTGDGPESYAGEIFYMNNCSDSVVTGLTISTLLQEGQFIKLSRGCSFIKIFDCHCYDISNYSTAGTIRIEGCSDVDVDGCSINATDRGDAATFTPLIWVLEHSSTMFSSSRVNVKNCTLTGNARGFQISATSDYPINDIVFTSNFVDVTNVAFRHGEFCRDITINGGIMRSAERITAPISTDLYNDGDMTFYNVLFEATGEDNRYVYLHCTDSAKLSINSCSVVGKTDPPNSAFNIDGELDTLVFTNNIYYPDNTVFPDTIGNSIMHNNFGYAL